MDRSVGRRVSHFFWGGGGRTVTLTPGLSSRIIMFWTHLLYVIFEIWISKCLCGYILNRRVSHFVLESLWPWPLVSVLKDHKMVYQALSKSFSTNVSQLDLFLCGICLVTVTCLVSANTLHKLGFLTLKAPRKKCIWKCRLLKSSAANNCLT